MEIAILCIVLAFAVFAKLMLGSNMLNPMSGGGAKLLVMVVLLFVFLLCALTSVGAEIAHGV